MAISQFERAIDEHIASSQKAEGLTVTVDLTKPIVKESERRQESINRQLCQKGQNMRRHQAIK